MVFPRELMTCAVVFQLCPCAHHSRPQSLRSFWPAAGIESSGSNHFEMTKEITEFCPSGLTQPHPRPQCYSFRMSLTSSPGRTKNFEFFHWLTKNGCAAEMKITKLYASHFTSGPDGGWCALRKNKQNKWRPFLIDPKES